ncbi:hypothetical protein ABT095_15180 [Kitasatospora sp. NPDC002227]|uniref:hypothetical protein n=1 Tax=Kitasatospora sp. NPDC002227 TaxID=3154773 RepID=UPI00332DE945
MSYDYEARGTITVSPPVPTAALWDLFHPDRRRPFAIAPAAGEWQLTPSADATTDKQGRPSHIAALVVDADATSYEITARLREFEGWVGPDHELDGHLDVIGESLERGRIYPWDDDYDSFPCWEF